MNPIRAVAAVMICGSICLAAQSPPTTAAPTQSGYILGPNDEIVILNLELPDSSGSSDKPILIGANGNITLPLVGRIQAAGLTVEQLETDLTTRFKEFILEPQILVRVTEFRSQPVSVFGAVTKPGVVYLRGQQTLYEVLSMAGGPSETAGSTLTLTRRRENGDIALPGARLDGTGRFSSIELNIQEILAGKNLAANIEMRPNDLITISEASSNVIYVVGDVQHAGVFTLGGQPNVSVLRAISLAGGLGHTARGDRARIIHAAVGQTTPSETIVDIKKLLAGKAKDVAMGPDDVLVVPTSGRKVFATNFLPTGLSAAVVAAIYRF